MRLTSDARFDRPSFRETTFATVATGLLILLIMMAFDAQSRVTHPLWLDECITALIANDESFTHMLRAIHGGAENNPPTFYLALWPTARLFGGLGAVGLRVFAGIAMLVALVGVYSIARLSFDWKRAAIGALAVAAHPIVIAQMFEARFYGAWLAATTWFVFFMLFLPNKSHERRLLICRCVLALIVATIHWFGILIVALVVAGAAWSGRHTEPAGAGTRRKTLAPALVALIGVVLFSPFLVSQRSGLSVPTWIEPTTGQAVLAMAHRLFVNPAVLVVTGLVILRLVRPPRVGRLDLAERARLAPLWALLLFPVFITAFSLLVQPLLYERYLIPGVLPLGALAAWAAPESTDRINRGVLGLVAIVLAVAMGREMRRYNRAVSITDWRIRNAVSAVDRIIATGGPRPIVFARRFEQYPVIQERPALASSVALIDFDGTPDSLMQRTIFERDMARRMTRFYPSHRLARLDSLRQSAEFFVITSSNEEDELRRLFAGFTVFRRAPDVYSVSR